MGDTETLIKEMFEAMSAKIRQEAGACSSALIIVDDDGNVLDVVKPKNTNHPDLNG